MNISKFQKQFNNLFFIGANKYKIAPNWAQSRGLMSAGLETLCKNVINYHQFQHPPVLTTTFKKTLILIGQIFFQGFAYFIC